MHWLVLSQSFVEDAVKLLVTRFIPLEEADLQEWQADPEEWVNLEEKDNEQWEYELRVCMIRYTFFGPSPLMRSSTALRRASVDDFGTPVQTVCCPATSDDLPASCLSVESLYIFAEQR